MKTKDHGAEFEDSIAALLNLRFLEDIVVRGPKVVFGRGKPEELADAILVYDNTLYAFQCKSREIDKHPGHLDGVDQGRIVSRVGEAVEQLKTIRRAIQQGLDLNLINSRGIRIPFVPSSETQLVGIVLLNLHGEQHLPFAERVQITDGVTIMNEMPIHIFKSEDFWHITHFNDTPSDLAKYLDTRFKLHANGVIFPFTRELDYLVIYKTRYPVVKDALDGKMKGIGIEGGYSLKFFMDHEVELRARHDRLKVSYLIDEIIRETHLSVGFNPASELPIGHGRRGDIASLGPGTAESYFAIATELSKLGRIERLALAEAFLEKAIKADKEGFGYKLCMFDKAKGTAFLVYSQKGDRAVRLERFQGLCEYACVQSGADALVGIATEPASSCAHSYDFVLLKRDDIPPDERDKLRAPSIFKSGDWGKMQEWGCNT
jgi:hypothetical protein